jgi:hypothetical protein
LVEPMSAAVGRPRLELREGEFVLDAEPRGLYGRTTRKTSRRRLHYVLQAKAVWRRSADRPATFERLAILTDCGDWLFSAELHVRETSDPPCDYCAFANSRYQKSKLANGKVDF